MNSQQRIEPSGLRIIFAGTPEFSAVQLQALLDGPHQIIAAYTQPDRKTGRGKKIQPSPVKVLASRHDIPVYQPASLRSADAQAELAALSADVMIVVAYGLLLPQAVLDIPRYGCINVHASLLPRWRGAAPIERAIEAGDNQTGITIMQMDAGLDTGAMLHKVCCAIDTDTTGDSLRERLSQLGPAALHTTLQQLTDGQLEPVIQREQDSCYAHKIDKQEAWLDWAQPATALARKIRALRSANVTCSNLDGQRIKIWMAQPEAMSSDQAPGTIIDSGKQGIRIACGDGVLCISELQLPGRKTLTAAAVLNAWADLFHQGKRFSSPIDEHCER